VDRDSNLPIRALKPVVSVSKGATVMEAIQQMVDHIVGATVVLDDGRLVGVFTERDVVTRVVLKRRDPETTAVAEVMTQNPITVAPDTDRKDALRMMIDKHIRHLPVVEADGRVVAMLSMRHLLRADVDMLERTVWALVAETAIDGPGG